MSKIEEYEEFLLEKCKIYKKERINTRKNKKNIRIKSKHILDRRNIRHFRKYFTQKNKKVLKKNKNINMDDKYNNLLKKYNELNAKFLYEMSEKVKLETDLKEYKKLDNQRKRFSGFF